MSETGGRTELREVIVEFGRHLDMLGDQLGASLREADRDSVSVGESFHEMSAVKAALESLSLGGSDALMVKDACERIDSSLHTAVVALQYHDRLAQRLEIVRAGLERLQSLLHDRSGRTTDQWLQSLRDVEHINRVEQLRLGPIPGAPGLPPPSDVSQSSVELF